LWACHGACLVAEDSFSAHVIRRRVRCVQPLSAESLVMSAVVAAFVGYHGEQTVVFAVQETA
jgi:hypothetical protein